MCTGWQVSAREQRGQKRGVEVQKLAQTWSEAAPTEEIKVRSNLFAGLVLTRSNVVSCLVTKWGAGSQLACIASLTGTTK